MTKSREELEIEKLEKFVEIDVEYCVPHEINEVRHIVDWGPFDTSTRSTSNSST